MKINRRLMLSIAVLTCGTSVAMADESAFPHALNAAELQKLYGEHDAAIDAIGPKGRVKYDVTTNGKLVGHNLDLIGSAAVVAGTSDGKWHVDAATNKVCHEWSNARWQNACFVVLQMGPDAYEWSPTGTPGGTKFTIRPK